MITKAKKLLFFFVLFALLTFFIDNLPRIFPTPLNPSSFGGSEVIFIQRNMSTQLLDYLCVVIYCVGYPLLMYGTAALLLWKKDIKLFNGYLWTFLFSQTLAVLTWLVYPVAPPRIAVSGVRNIRGEIFGFSESFNAFKYGAFPSMHAANCLTALLFVRKLKKKIWTTVWGLSWVVLMFSAVYLGEHYWQDLIAGCLYSLVSCFLITGVVKRWHSGTLYKRGSRG